MIRASMVSLGCALLALGSASCREQVEARAPSPRPVVVVQLERSDPAVALELTGVVEPWNVEDIAFEVSGRLDYVVEAGTFLRGRWQEGETLITEGDVLAMLDPVPFETAVRVTQADVEAARVRHARVLPAQLKSAEASLVAEQQEYKRTEELRKSDIAADLELVRARAALDSAEANVEQVQAEIESAAAELSRAEATLAQRALDLDNARLFAPFDGEISETYVRAGGYVTAGQAVARLVTMNPVLIELAVSAETSRLISIDNSAKLFVDGRLIEQRGKVYQKSTVADPSTRTFSVKVITRNLRRPVAQPKDPAILELPRVETLMPIIRLDPHDRGQLFAEEGAIGEDDKGAFVWKGVGVVADADLAPDDPSFSVQKVYVQLGERRMNFQKVFTFRELADPGALEYFDLAVLGVPEGVGDGGRVALIRETWQLSPGDLVTVRLGRDAGPKGFYVPIEAIDLDAEGQSSVFVIERDPDGGATARRVPVTVHNAVGTDRRIVGDGLEGGVQIVRRGASYLQDGERVSVTR